MLWCWNFLSFSITYWIASQFIQTFVFVDPWTTYLLHSIPIADLLASRVCKPPLVAILIKINFHLVTVTPILKYKYHFVFSLCALRYQHWFLFCSCLHTKPWSKPLNGCETHFVGPAVFGLLHVRTFSSFSLTVTFKIGRHKANLEFALHEVIIHLQVSFKIYMALTLAITIIVLNAFLYLMSFGLS